MNCACRVTWAEVVAVCGLPSGSPPTDRCLPDWADRPSLSVEDAAAFVHEYRAELAAKQRKQDELTASREAQYAAYRAREAAFWAAQRREAERVAAIREGGNAAAASLTGLVTPERQQQGWADGAELAAELFDQQDPVQQPA